MKRFILFTGDFYYPTGGADDLRGFFDSVEECESFLLDVSLPDWAHVLDCRSGAITPLDLEKLESKKLEAKREIA